MNTSTADSNYQTVFTAITEDAKLRADLAMLVVENAEVIELLLAAAKIADADEDPFVVNQVLEAAHRLSGVNETLEQLSVAQILDEV